MDTEGRRRERRERERERDRKNKTLLQHTQRKYVAQHSPHKIRVEAGLKGYWWATGQ